jgi:hypothetical protein
VKIVIEEIDVYGGPGLPQIKKAALKDCITRPDWPEGSQNTRISKKGFAIWIPFFLSSRASVLGRLLHNQDEIAVTQDVDLPT